MASQINDTFNNQSKIRLFRSVLAFEKSRILPTNYSYADPKYYKIYKFCTKMVPKVLQLRSTFTTSSTFPQFHSKMRLSGIQYRKTQ